MKRIFTLTAMLCALVQYSAKAQINGQQPGTALSICNGSALSIGTVPGYNGGALPSSCLAAGALNPYWYTFTFTSFGTVGFTITPNNINDDYDFAVYDISNVSASAAATAPLVSCNYSGYTGVTGSTSSGSGTSNGANGSNQNQLINVTPGQTLALVVSHYTSSNQSGYQLQFTGGTVMPSPLPPAMDTSYVSNCNQKLNVIFNQSLQCSSIASNGSDFYLMPGNIPISAASGVGCGTTTFTNRASLTLPSNIAVGNYTLHVKNGSDGNTVTDVCGNNVPTSNTVTFRVDPAPAPNVTFAITSADTQCQYKNSFDFNNTSTVSSGTMTYAWAFGDNGSATFTSGSHAYNAAGVYSVKLTATTNQGCIDSVKDTSVVLSSPGVPAKVSPVNYCINETPVALSATPSANSIINWYSAPTSGTANPTPPTPSTTVVGTYTFYVSQTLTTTGCEGPRDSIKVVVKPLPAGLTASSNTPVCSKDTVKLTGGSSSIGVTYAWTGPNNYTSTQQNPTVDSATMAADGTYKMVVTLNGCKDSTTTVVIMKQTPYNLAASSNTPVCSDALNVLNLSSSSSNPAATYSWNGPNGYTGNTQNPAISPVLVGMAGKYIATVSANGCSDTVSTVVVVNQTPVGLTAGNSGVVCSGPGSSVQLSANTTTPGGVTYSWTGPNGYTSNLQNPTITNLTVANAGKYICTVTLGTCSDTVSTIVTVKQTPVGLIATSNSPLCSGPLTNINLNATTTTPGAITYAWTGPNVYTSNIQNPVINAAATTMSGKYIATITLNGCSDTVSTMVTVNQTPIAPTAVDTVWYCNNGTPAALTATGINLKWYTAIGGTGTATAPTPSTATVGTTTYYVSQTSAANCEGPVDSIVVVVKPNPARPAVTTPIEYCLNDAPVALIATPATGGILNWYTSATSGIASGTTPIPSTAIANVYKWYVSQTVIGCEGPRDSIQVTVKPLPVVPVVGSNTPVCSGTGNTLNLTSSSTTIGVTYGWTGPNSYVAASQNPSITAPTIAATGTYVVTVTLNGCISTASTTVVVNQTPVAPTVVPTIDYCQYLPTTILSATAAAGNTLKWYTSNASTTPLSAAPTPSSLTSGTTTWYVSQTTPQGCEGPRASIAVTIKPKPAPPVPLSTSAYTFCQAQVPTQLSATGQNLLWYTSLTGSSATSYTPVTNVPDTITIYVTQTVNGCESDKQPIEVLVKPKPVPPVISTPVIYCQNAIVGSVDVAGQNITYYTSLTGTGSATPYIPNTTVLDTIAFYATQTVHGCESDKATGEVYIREKLEVQIQASRPFVCIGDTLTLRYIGKPSPNTVYNWENPIPSTTYISGMNEGPMVYRFNEVDAPVIKLTVDNAGCMSDTTKYTVDVRALPAFKLSSRSEICKGDTVVVMPEPKLPGATYKWNFGAATALPGAPPSGPYELLLNYAGTYTYIISATATANGCTSKPVYDTISVRSLPDAQIVSVSANDICIGDSTELSAQYLGDQYTYQWEPAQLLDNANSANAWARPTTSQIFFLTVTDDLGCKAMDSVTITAKPCCKVYFPTAFTPNGDGKNDVFRIISPVAQPVSSFVIVNRWGQTVYNANDARKGWDGTFNGIPQDIGTYYYKVQYTCSDGHDYTEQGEIVLLR